jgi:hypothetical protein
LMYEVLVFFGNDQYFNSENCRLYILEVGLQLPVDVYFR